MAKKHTPEVPVHKHAASVQRAPRKRSADAGRVFFRMSGKQMTRTFTTERHAEEWAEVVRREGPERALALLEGTDLKVANEWKTFDDLAERYIETRWAGRDGASLLGG